MSLHLNGSGIASFLYTEDDNFLYESAWHFIYHLHLLLNILALLCYWVLIRSRGSRAFGALYDTAVILTLVGVRNRHGFYAALNDLFASLDPREDVRKTLGRGVIAVAIFMVLYYFQHYHRLSSKSSGQHESSCPTPLQPRMFPCRTTHTRFFPKNHSFAYSYLYAGIPVGWQGATNTILSADTCVSHLQNVNSKFRKTWFSVQGRDYLQRTGSGARDLLGKLHSYFESQSVAPQLYPYVYLVTAPRFLGFSFNPVSFWYLYSAQKELTAMLLEVNNTFDERRMYFLEKSNMEHDFVMDEKNTFTFSWKKDFHVSPFNDRGGNYALKARDPFAPRLSGDGRIDNTITLSLDGRPKMVARVFSSEPAVLASKVNRFQALRFVSKWWWVGFMTNVRIIHEARKLWVKKLQVFYRPEVTKSITGRRATPEEDVLANNFPKFLRYMQSRSSSRLPIRYTAAAGRNRGDSITIMDSNAPNEMAPNAWTVDFHVLTPAFYSSFIQFPDATKAFRALCLCEAEDERLAILSNPNVFLQETALVESFVAQSVPLGVLRDGPVPVIAGKSQIWLRWPVRFSKMFSAWANLKLLRLSHPVILDLAVFSFSAREHEENRQYSRAVVTVLLAKKLAFGSTSLLRLFGNLLRYGLLWLISARIEAIIITLQRDFST